MIRILALTAGLMTFAVPAAAQSTFERFESVAVAMNGRINEALVAQIPSVEGNLPDPAWDAPLRTAYTCMYDAYVAEVGEAAIAEMVISMEAELETVTNDQILNGGFATESPEGISDEQALEIVGGCRLMDVFMERMVASGAMEIMMQESQ